MRVIERRDGMHYRRGRRGGQTCGVSSLHRERYTAWDGNGRERLDIVRDGMGTVFKLIATRGNRTGMDLSQLDGTGLVMIVIPMSLSTC